jgi:uncharacterized membrane protein YidH (DUF202 family)
VSDADVAGDGFADQRARTSLAWSRTALGSVAVALLVARLAWLYGGESAWALLPAVLGAVVAVVAYVRTRSLASSRAAVPRPEVAVVAGVVVLLGAASALLVLTR